MSKSIIPSWCGSSEHPWHPSRREFLYVGMLGSFGLSLGNLFKLHAAPTGTDATRTAHAQSVINIYLPGGMAAQETFDPKLLAPIEYRGPLSPLKTKLDGVYFSELMKETARIANKLCVIRSMTHGEADHDRGTHNMFTGYRPSPALQYPSFGSIVSHELGSRNDLPAYVCVPSLPSNFAGTGYLGSAYGAFSLGADPASKEFKVRDLNLPNGVDEARFAQRREMRAAVGCALQRVGKVRRVGRDGFLLSTGLCDVEFGQGACGIFLEG
jgi:hypothetical protein